MTSYFFNFSSFKPNPGVVIGCQARLWLQGTAPGSESSIVTLIYCAEGLGHSDLIQGSDPAESLLVDAVVQVTPDFGACHCTRGGFP